MSDLGALAERALAAVGSAESAQARAVRERSLLLRFARLVVDILVVDNNTEDPELVKHLAQQRIPLELCLTGNVRGRQVDSYASHPVRRYFDLGIPISLNTDDPLFFGNSLVDEYAAVQQFHRFTRDDIRRVIVSAIDSTWLPADGKARLSSDFREDPAWGEA